MEENRVWPPTSQADERAAHREFFASTTDLCEGSPPNAKTWQGFGEHRPTERVKPGPAELDARKISTEACRDD